jgi:hypothetical protein
MFLCIYYNLKKKVMPYFMNPIISVCNAIAIMWTTLLSFKSLSNFILNKFDKLEYDTFFKLGAMLEH